MKKTAVVTGATNGLGWALAHTLARYGYRLVLPCRSLERAEAVRSSLLLHFPRAEMDFFHCDLADLAAVARCGQALAARHPVLDIVIANAATVSPVYASNMQGVELTFAVNHLAHFVLLDWLKGNLFTHSRVITLTSSCAKWGEPGFIEDINYQRQRYGMFKAYANSKMANIAFSQYLAAELTQRQMACLSVHPGMLDTGIWPRREKWQQIAVGLLKILFLATPEQGARVIEDFAVAADHNETTGYFDRNTRAQPPATIDDSFCEKLWELSTDLGRDFLRRREV